MVGVHLFRYKVHYETHIVFRLHEIKKHQEQQAALLTEYDESIVRELEKWWSVTLMWKSGKTMKLKWYTK